MIPRLHPDFLKKPLTHRGLHDVLDGRPENSRAAIRAAIVHGYGIEIDLQLSADQTPMVFHDYGLNPLTAETGTVAQMKAAQLGAIQLTGGNEGIPTLDEVLALVAGQVPLLIELKDQDGAMGTNVGSLEKVAADLLSKYSGPVAVMSFNPNSVERLAEFLPAVARGIVTSAYTPDDWPLSQVVCDHLRDVPDYDRVGASFISHELTDLGRARVAELKANGANVLCWTVKSTVQEVEARKVAENITFEQYLA
ncbi:glycerophosphodiester phosphodiesterase family protein [Ascidiaceihabitans sp.]|nr:glycerophosphodiester phosphodiesterase family protein [Ascidiaceihabitans sp.]MDA9136324.1 glycerophosphodiester phosphodiesterase family protein [Ascidiaceihabitans sp.]